jgi:uncharacterized protein YaaN involved in tellurite resistance
MEYERLFMNSLNALNRKMDKMSLDISRLVADVEAEKTVIEGAVTLLARLAQAMRDLQVKLDAAIAASDPAAQAAVQAQLDELATQVETSTTALSRAVSDNT